MPPVIIPQDEVSTPSTACQYHPKFSIKPAKQDFALNIGDKPITQTFSGGQQTLKIIQPPNGQIVTLLGLSFSEDGSATIQFEAREVGTTYFIIGDECGYQATVNVTVNNPQAPEEIETPLTNCQSAPNVPLKPEQNHIIMNNGDSRVLWFTGGLQKRWLSTPPAGEIVRLESVEFPTEGGAKATQTGETQLGISDCVSESIVNLTINDKILSCTSLPAEPQAVKLLEGDASLLKTFAGDQVKIIQPPDDTIVTLELPIFSADGLTQLKLTPRQAGTTQIILGNCTGETVVNVSVLKRGTLAYACQLVGKKDGVCENIKPEQLLESNSLGINAKGEAVETTAYFANFANQFEIIPDSKNYVIGQTDDITAKLAIVADDAHIDLPAEILLIMAHQSNGKPAKFFMYNGTTWQPWLSSDLSDLVAAKQYAHLPLMLEISPDLKTLDSVHP